MNHCLPLVHFIDAYSPRFESANHEGTPEVLMPNIRQFQLGDCLWLREVKGWPALPTGRVLCREVISIRPYTASLFGHVTLGERRLKSRTDEAEPAVLEAAS